jgi:hypothetical protein
VTVKFLDKSTIPETNWVQDRDGRVPMEVLMYRSNKHIGLPHYLQDFEDEEYFYIVTEIHGIRRENVGFFESKYHHFEWQLHFK